MDPKAYGAMFLFWLNIAKIRSRFGYFTFAWGKIWYKMGFLAKIHSA
jgi:hypothetical protein